MPAYDPRVLNTQVPRSSKKRATAFAKKFLIVKKPSQLASQVQVTISIKRIFKKQVTVLHIDYRYN